MIFNWVISVTAKKILGKTRSPFVYTKSDPLGFCERIYREVENRYFSMGDILKSKNYISGYKRTIEIVEYEKHPEYDRDKKIELLTTATRRTLEFASKLEQQFNARTNSDYDNNNDDYDEDIEDDDSP